MKTIKFSLFTTLLLVLFMACSPKDTIEFLSDKPDLTLMDTNKILVETSYQSIFNDIFSGPNTSGSEKTNEWKKTGSNYTENARILANNDNVQVILRKSYTDGTIEEVKKSYFFSESGSTNLSMTIVDGTIKRRTFRSGSEITAFISQFKTSNDFYTFKF